MTAQLLPVDGPAKEMVLTRATVRAASFLGLSNKVLANIIGVSEATASRMHSGGYELKRGQKPYECAALFARFYRALDAIVGGDDGVAKQWLNSENTALNGVPIELIQTLPGLINVINYLDTRRAPI